MTSPRDFPAPHILAITLCDRDIDGMRDTNNACYVIWRQRCAWEHCQAGLSVADDRRLNRGVAIHHVRYDYVAPA